MTPSEALQWADKNCQPETVERLRSRAAVAALAAEVRRMRGRIEFLRGALNVIEDRDVSNNAWVKDGHGKKTPVTGLNGSAPVPHTGLTVWRRV